MKHIPLEAVHSIHNQNSFFQFLKDHLGWKIQDDVSFDNLTYDYFPKDIGLKPEDLRGSRIFQLRPFTNNQPWGIFFIHLAKPQVYVTQLRKLIRALAPMKRKHKDYPTWNPTNLLFICTPDWKNYTFAHFKGDNPTNARISTFGWSPSEPMRTALEFNLPSLRMPEEDLKGISPAKWFEQWNTAFDVERVTRDFFIDYKKIFYKVEEEITGVPKEHIHMFAQSLFNRLLFLKFLERKQWLDFDRNYLFNKFEKLKKKSNYYEHFLLLLFFQGLNRKHPGAQITDAVREQIGIVPYLNGGLFEESIAWNERKAKIPNDVFELIFDGLFNKYNFTVMESTPLDVEVAVDPEILGKVFEELVIERNERGAFYTPRQSVSAMCRNALKAYLSTKWEEVFRVQPVDYTLPLKTERKGQQDINDLLIESQEREHRRRIRRFVDEGIVDFTVDECKKIINWLDHVKINDPAIGSGAFHVGMLHELVRLYRLIFPGAKQSAKSDYELKLQIIQNNLYGADIDEFAVNIAHLRLWLTLAVDYPTHFETREQFEREIKSIPPLPNLYFKIRTGDSLLEKVGNIHFESEQQELAAQSPEILKMIRTLRMEKEDFFGHRKPDGTFIGTTDEEKHKLKKEIAELEHDLLRTFLSLTARVKKHTRKNGTLIEREVFTDDDIRNCKSIIWAVHFSEIFDESQGEGNFGFDIQIANPPYGLKTDEGKELYKLGSKDSYGAFCAMAIQKLKPNGILCFIQSDTWQTIKTHKPLRRLILDNAKILSLVMMPSWTFSATVNTSILLAQRCSGGSRKHLRHENTMIAADFTNIPKDDERVGTMLLNLHDLVSERNEEFAVYSYQQGLIERNSNIPFFVGSPKLFTLMFDDDKILKEKREIGEKEKKKVDVRKIKMNGNTVEIVRFGDVADIKVGLQTGDNDYYIRQSEGVRGSYEIIDESLVLTDGEIKKLTDGEKQNGVDPRKHGGKHFLPYDKGGESDSEEGWLPNYFVPTGYFIDWSKKAVTRLKESTIADIKKSHDKKISKNDENTLAAVIRNPDFYFRMGLSFSDSGIYSPSFRISASSVFDQKGSIVVSEVISPYMMLGLACSKLSRYILKGYVNHTISSHVDSIKEIPFVVLEEPLIKSLFDLVDRIIRNQKKNPSYPYHLHEQREIDRLVYEMYGLNEDDIKEVETWYRRRYPKLARAQGV